MVTKNKQNKLTESRELHRAVITKFKTRRIIVKGIEDIWAGDLLMMSTFSKENKNYKYILNVIDCFSKYVWSVALKKKNSLEVSDAFEKIQSKTSSTAC